MRLFTVGHSRGEFARIYSNPRRTRAPHTMKRVSWRGIILMLPDTNDVRLIWKLLAMIGRGPGEAYLYASDVSTRRLFGPVGAAHPAD